jgi:hypothetical protein
MTRELAREDEDITASAVYPKHSTKRIMGRVTVDDAGTWVALFSIADEDGSIMTDGCRRLWFSSMDIGPCLRASRRPTRDGCWMLGLYGPATVAAKRYIGAGRDAVLLCATQIIGRHRRLTALGVEIVP